MMMTSSKARIEMACNLENPNGRPCSSVRVWSLRNLHCFFSHHSDWHDWNEKNEDK